MLRISRSNHSKGTLELIALVCQKFDNYEDEFTFALMNHFTPEQLTLATRRVDLTIDVNKKLVELLSNSLEPDDIEEEIGYELFKLDRKMNSEVFKNTRSEDEVSYRRELEYELVIEDSTSWDAKTGSVRTLKFSRRFISE